MWVFPVRETVATPRRVAASDNALSKQQEAGFTHYLVVADYFLVKLS